MALFSSGDGSQLGAVAIDEGIIDIAVIGD